MRAAKLGGLACWCMREWSPPPSPAVNHSPPATARRQHQPLTHTRSTPLRSRPSRPRHTAPILLHLPPHPTAVPSGQPSTRGGWRCAARCGCSRRSEAASSAHSADMRRAGVWVQGFDRRGDERRPGNRRHWLHARARGAPAPPTRRPPRTDLAQPAAVVLVGSQEDLAGAGLDRHGALAAQRERREGTERARNGIFLARGWSGAAGGGRWPWGWAGAGGCLAVGHTAAHE